MIWVGVWVLLVLLAGLVLFVLGRSIWRKTALLLREAGEATGRLGQAAARIEVATGTTATVQLAVFDDPNVLRREQRPGRSTGQRGRHLSRPVR